VTNLVANTFGLIMERKGSKRFARIKGRMQSLKRRLSFRKKKDHSTENNQDVQKWNEDTDKVRNGTCSFQVRYLGYIEVFDSRGMHICEEAIKALKAQCKGKYQRAVLYVSGDALRVVDEVSKSMIVDQTIEKVSFCAPDRHYEKAFAYICRDGTTRRWMCHGFLAVKDSGERLSHAVGCAFAICLEKKQKRGAEAGVTVTYNQNRTSFERTGSFRQTTLTERIADPQSAILAEPVPANTASGGGIVNPFAVQRPHATANLLERQGSFRGFEKLNEISSPFKRTTSLRLSDLPSTLQRQNAVMEESPLHNGNGAVGGTIAEHEQEDSIAQMCQQLTEGLSALTSDDPFSNAPTQKPRGLTHQASLPTSAASPYQTYQPQVHGHVGMLTRQHTSPASQTLQTPYQGHSINPWAQATNNNITSSVGAASTPPGSTNNPFMSPAPAFQHSPQPMSRVSMVPPGTSAHYHPAGAAALNPPPQQYQPGVSVMNQPHPGVTPQQNLFAQNSSIGSRMASGRQQTHQVVKASSTPNSAQNGVQSNMATSSPWPTTAPAPPSSGPSADPFDVAWAAKSVNQATPNTIGRKSVKKFEVQL